MVFGTIMFSGLSNLTECMSILVDWARDEKQDKLEVIDIKELQ